MGLELSEIRISELEQAVALASEAGVTIAADSIAHRFSLKVVDRQAEETTERGMIAALICQRRGDVYCLHLIPGSLLEATMQSEAAKENNEPVTSDQTDLVTSAESTHPSMIQLQDVLDKALHKLAAQGIASCRVILPESASETGDSLWQKLVWHDHRQSEREAEAAQTNWPDVDAVLNKTDTASDTSQAA